MTFDVLGLDRPILDALAQQGFETPTPIQSQAIPAVLEGRDVIGLAQTGTGKTAAFGLPLLQRLSESGRSRHIRVLILSPTRELAGQIQHSIHSLGKGLGLRTKVVMGGVPIRRQKNALASGVDILVATPGRLLDLVEQRSVWLDKIEALVLDEADHMLDIGFMPAIRQIIKLIPKQRQTLLFSATMPPAIRALAQEQLKDPIEIAVATVSKTADRIDQSVRYLTRPEKVKAALDIAREHQGKRIIVFSRTKHGADRIVKNMTAADIGAAAIHGNKSQGQRERALENFRSGKAPVLVATDIAARGIDVQGVEVVINYDLPDVPEVYVHRIGRTARAGASGIAIAFCSEEERGNLRDIEKLLKAPIEVVGPAPTTPLQKARPAPGGKKRRLGPPPRQRRSRSGGQRPPKAAKG